MLLSCSKKKLFVVCCDLSVDSDFVCVPTSPHREYVNESEIAECNSPLDAIILSIDFLIRLTGRNAISGD